MVRREETLAEVVPMATKSPTVVCLTKVPVSVQPAAEGIDVVHERAPAPSVRRTPFAVCVEGQVYVCVLNCVVPVIAKVEEPVIGPEELREPETKREEPMVEEAEERSPPVKVPSPVTERVEEPLIAPAVLIPWLTKSEPPIVEEEILKRFWKMEVEEAVMPFAEERPSEKYEYP